MGADQNKLSLSVYNSCPPKLTWRLILFIFAPNDSTKCASTLILVTCTHLDTGRPSSRRRRRGWPRTSSWSSVGSASPCSPWSHRAASWSSSSRASCRRTSCRSTGSGRRTPHQTRPCLQIAINQAINYQLVTYSVNKSIRQAHTSPNPPLPTRCNQAINQLSVSELFSQSINQTGSYLTEPALA